jgi:RNase P/RNase MRP subunit p29
MSPQIHLNHHQQQVMLQLHEMWKEYFHSLLHSIPVTPNVGTRTPTNSLDGNTIELVGAHVRIVQCKAHGNWIHKEGIVVVDTLNTWQVALVPFDPACISTINNKQKNPKDGDTIKTTNVPWKVVLVPKRGSILELDAPLPVSWTLQEMVDKKARVVQDPNAQSTSAQVSSIDNQHRVKIQIHG